MTTGTSPLPTPTGAQPLPDRKGAEWSKEVDDTAYGTTAPRVAEAKPGDPPILVPSVNVQSMSILLLESRLQGTTLTLRMQSAAGYLRTHVLAFEFFNESEPLCDLHLTLSPDEQTIVCTLKRPLTVPLSVRLAEDY